MFATIQSESEWERGAIYMHIPSVKTRILGRIGAHAVFGSNKADQEAEDENKKLHLKDDEINLSQIVPKDNFDNQPQTLPADTTTPSPHNKHTF